jgi:hypothetical protein
MQTNENGFRAATTRVVNINKNYGGKGQYIRLAAIENGCVKWLVFGMPKPAGPAGGGGGGGPARRRPPTGRSPVMATVWLVCGTMAVEQILAGATQDTYSEITNALREALLMRSGTRLEIKAQQTAIGNVLSLSGPKIKFEYTQNAQAGEWFRNNFGFLYSQETWDAIGKVARDSKMGF